MICTRCKISFEIFPEDQVLYKKCDAPVPNECFDCRQEHLMMFINQINLYQRTCDATGETIISNYSSDKPYKVFKMEYWWSDTWDAEIYGQEFDFNRPFFEQFQELSLKVPRPALFTAFQYDENSAYTNHAGKDKNCYMIFDSDENRDCYYSYSINKCMDCCDLYRTRQSELCYECIDSILCYNSFFLQDCAQCRDSAFLKDCKSCKSCFMCCNLHHKEYYFMNEYMGKEKYEQLMRSLTSRKKIEEWLEQFQKFKLKFPKRYLQMYKSENSIGNYLVNAKNAYFCFDSNDLWDCRYVTQSFMPVKDCIDNVEIGGGELLCMNATGGYNTTRLKYCAQVLDQVHECTYCMQCHFSSNLFGCVGLRRKKYCILNKKYDPEEYKIMVQRITEHMKKTREYGQFFPPSLSPFCYNETLAEQWYPLTKEEVLQKGLRWKKENIQDVNEKVCDQAFTCTACNKKFRIAKQELIFYKRQGIGLPAKCFKCRHSARVRLRTRRKIQQRTCFSCGKKIYSTIIPSSSEIVYCEKCYLQKVD